MSALMKAALLAACCIVFAGCQSTPRPVTDHDPDVDFSQFATFSWIDPNPLIRVTGQRPLNPLIQQRLMTAAQAAFSERGLRFVDNPEDADLVMAFTVGSRAGIRVTSYPSSWHRHSPSRRSTSRSFWSGYWSNSTVRTRTYTEGQLAIDLLDVQAARPVWHGTVSQRITRQDRGDPGPALETAVKAIAESFPPG